MLATAASVIGQIILALVLAAIPAVALGALVAWLSKGSGPMAGQGTALAFMIVAGGSYPLFLAATVCWGW